MRWLQFTTIASFIVLLATAAAAQPEVRHGEWPITTRDPYGSRSSPLDQITKENVGQLERAWTVRTGDMAPEGPHYAQCTPIMVNNTLYLITTLSNALALDATTGDVRWKYEIDPPLNIRETGAGGLASRGVTYWESGDKRRIFLPVRDGRVYSLEAETGQPDPEFGENGILNLRAGLPDGGWYMFISSPPAVYEDLLIFGCGINDTGGHNLPHVPVRAFSAHTGELVWTFNTVPQEGEYGTHTWANESWRDRGGANVWSFMSVDPERGMVFLPITAPNYDFYGGDRHGKNLFTNCVVALDAATGERIWHYQTIFHDLWDYDLAAQPNLVDVTINGETVPAVAQAGKTGFIYVLHRETGEPLFPVEHRRVPQSDLPGEETWPVQPFPLKPPPISRQIMTEDDVTDISEDNRDFVLHRLRGARSEGIYTPPAKEGTVIFPGLHGGANWSGASTTPEGIMFINATELPYLIHMDQPANPDAPFPYTIRGFTEFRDREGYPAVKPPWGKFLRVDLNEGVIDWEVPLGEHVELTERGIPITGQPNFGGSSVTATGLVFIAATQDERIRAFDSDTGDILFEHQMEAAGYTTPITYLGEDGKQYVTIFAGGGGKYQTTPGDYVISFTLPDEE